MWSNCTPRQKIGGTNNAKAKEASLRVRWSRVQSRLALARVLPSQPAFFKYYGRVDAWLAILNDAELLRLMARLIQSDLDTTKTIQDSLV